MKIRPTIDNRAPIQESQKLSRSVVQRYNTDVSYTLINPIPIPPLPGPSPYSILNALVVFPNRKYIPFQGKRSAPRAPLSSLPRLRSKAKKKKKKNHVLGIRFGGGLFYIKFSCRGVWEAPSCQGPVNSTVSCLTHSHTLSLSLFLIPYPSNSACHRPY